MDGNVSTLVVTNAFQLPCVQIRPQTQRYRYGIIAQYQGKYCIVEVRYSSNYRRFIKGLFYVSELEELVKEFTDTEVNLLNELLTLDIESAVSRYDTLYRELYSFPCSYQGKNKRFADIHQRYAGKQFPLLHNRYLVLPGGYRELPESEEDAARREFAEETGITQSLDLLPETIQHIFVTWDKVTYVTKYYLTVIDKLETDFTKNNEIKRVIWCDDVPELNTDQKYCIKQILSKYIQDV